MTDLPKHVDNHQIMALVLSMRDDQTIAHEKMFERLDTFATKKDVKESVKKGVEDYFISKGRLTIRFVIGAGVLSGSLTAIAILIKGFFGWLGVKLGLIEVATNLISQK